jgi:CHRD domain
VIVDILLHTEQYYVNVHTVEFPAGAVQGDLA